MTGSVGFNPGLYESLYLMDTFVIFLKFFGKVTRKGIEFNGLRQKAGVI